MTKNGQDGQDGHYGQKIPWRVEQVISYRAIIVRHHKETWPSSKKTLKLKRESREF